MKKVFFICMLLLFAGRASASDLSCLERQHCLESELSHVAGGAVISGVATAIANKYWPEHRALIGFAVGAAVGVIGEGVQDLSGNGKFGLLDAAADIVGAAIGTLVTDKFILRPVVKQQSGNSYIGVAAQFNF